MHKQYEEEPRRIEHEDDATITFTVALHGPHAWEILLEDSRRYHSISHGWATDDLHDWEDAIAPLLRRFFVMPGYGTEPKLAPPVGMSAVGGKPERIDVRPERRS
jgi:hypothetical protein